MIIKRTQKRNIKTNITTTYKYIHEHSTILTHEYKYTQVNLTTPWYSKQPAPTQIQMYTQTRSY